MTSPTMDTFDPNASVVAQYATFVPGRIKGAFRVHQQRGHATTAFLQANSGIFYERAPDGRWVELARKDWSKRPSQCEVCRQSTMRKTTYGEHNTVRQVLDRRPSGRTGKVVWPPVIKNVCPECKRALAL